MDICLIRIPHILYVSFLRNSEIANDIFIPPVKTGGYQMIRDYVSVALYNNLEY